MYNISSKCFPIPNFFIFLLQVAKSKKNVCQWVFVTLSQVPGILALFLSTGTGIFFFFLTLTVKLKKIQTPEKIAVIILKLE